MNHSLSRTDEELTEIYYRNKESVYRICFAFLRNEADALDALQETFLRLVRSSPAFSSPEHEKAWLIRVACNVCKNELRFARRRTEDLDSHFDLAAPDDAASRDLLYAVLSLPEKYKTPVLLHYYEGYSCDEIARMLRKPASTVRSLLGKARRLLRDVLQDDDF